MDRTLATAALVASSGIASDTAAFLEGLNQNGNQGGRQRSQQGGIDEKGADLVHHQRDFKGAHHFDSLSILSAGHLLPVFSATGVRLARFEQTVERRGLRS